MCQNKMEKELIDYGGVYCFSCYKKTMGYGVKRDFQYNGSQIKKLSHHKLTGIEREDICD